MARKNFFELMEREVNFQDEYEKIENAIINDNLYGSLDDVIEKVFNEWKYRKNYISFWELRCQLNFTYSESEEYGVKYEPDRKSIKMNDFLTYAEMILNMLTLLNEQNSLLYTSKIQLVRETILYDLEKINYEPIEQNKGQIMIVQKDAAVSAVVDLVETDLARTILRYNHYLLKGDIEAKKEILRKIADALEPRRRELESVNKSLASDFFLLVNKMNIRHNNCDASDKAKYVEAFAKMTKKQKENWYDEIYQQGLMAFLTLEQAERNKRIAEFKKNLTGK